MMPQTGENSGTIFGFDYDSPRYY